MTSIKDQFLLNSEITYLNHGSFGACPKPIFEDYQKWQLMLERDPVQFVTKTSLDHLKVSKQALAEYINCEPDDFVYVTNPSTAGNIIIKGLDLKEGDEILTTDHEYGAMDRTWNYVCRKNGAKYVRQPISMPIQSKEAFLEEFWKGLSPKTKVVFISHITSPTAVVFPVKEICQKAKELGLITFIDGAHASGHVPLDLQELEVDIYTGACHKWLLTPKGSSFLYVRKELQDRFDPLIISWGYEAEFPSHSQFLDYHEYQGTRDTAAFLTLPAAFQFRKDFEWDERTAKCREMILHYYPEACKILNTAPICPLNSDFLGQLCSIPIKTTDAFQLKDLLFDQYKIEIPLPKMDDHLFIRISIQGYNDDKDIEILFDALRDIQSKTSLIQ
ncbi:MAG: aminotransferase class V-fold PLP-dependent enzyme [Flavobacteriales bacterium]|nr:aminotransferase class V-fold PLP-dependent enzyme [Flavobacteriales bacterium]